jgi:tight adherence protein C
MIGIIVFMIFITVFIFLQGIFIILQAPQKRIDQRLENIESDFQMIDHRDEEMDTSLSSRLLRPAIEGFGRFMFALSPKSKRDQLEVLLRRAGKSDKSAVGHWYINKMIFVVLLPIFCGVLFVLLEMDVLRSVLFSILIGLTFQLLQTILLKRQVSKRQNEMRNVLPDALDLITVSVEAGLSFDGAMDRVIRQMPNALSEEFAIALKEMRMGKTRREGLRALSQRCDVDDLTTLVGALIQADELGVRIGTVLRIQSEQMREKRRQRAREAAMKAPIKLLFPLMIFIFPTIFVILLGPAFIQMMDIF